MIIGKKAIMTACFVFSTTCGSAAFAQAVPQDPVSKAAVDVQQRAARGEISQKEAGKITGQLWKLKSEQDRDMARNGGYLTPQDKHNLWSEIHSVQGDNNFNGQSWNNGSRHGGLMDRFGNNGQFANGGYPNGGYPNGGYPNGGYPNGGYPRDGYPGNGYGGPAYGHYENANAYNNGYAGGGYPGNGPYDNGNGYNNGNFNNGASNSKFGQAASVLQNLLHH